MNMTHVSVKKEYTNTSNKNMDEYHWHFVVWSKSDIKVRIFKFHLYEVQEKPMVRNWYGCCLWGEVHLGQRRGTKEPSGMMEMLYILVWMGLRAHTQNFNKLYKIKIHILGCTVRNNSMKLLKTLLSPDCPVSPSFPPGRFAAQGMTFPSLLGK